MTHIDEGEQSWTSCDACGSRKNVRVDNDSGQYLCEDCKAILDALMEK